MLSVSQLTCSGMGRSKRLRMVVSKPVLTTTSSSSSWIVSNDRMWGSMLGTVTMKSRS